MRSNKNTVRKKSTKRRKTPSNPRGAGRHAGPPKLTLSIELAESVVLDFREYCKQEGISQPKKFMQWMEQEGWA